MDSSSELDAPPAMAEPSSASSLSPRAKVSAIMRRALAGSARAGDDNDLWITADSMRSSINNRYSRSQAPIEAFEVDLHDLWFTYYHAAMNISRESPHMDRLAFQVVLLREQVLTRRAPDNNAATEKAVTSGGHIWSDLPFLVPDMAAYWVNSCAAMSAAQRLNFSQFLAKLASVGLVDDGLSGIGLTLLRDTFESDRPIGDFGDQENEVAGREVADLSIAALLPAANTWLFTSRVKLIQLSENCWKMAQPAAGGLLQDDDPGFSPQRWLAWLRRLEEIVHEARQAGKESLANFAEKMMDNMLLTVDETDNAVKRALDEAGGVVQHKPANVLLGLC